MSAKVTDVMTRKVVAVRTSASFNEIAASLVHPRLRPAVLTVRPAVLWRQR